MMYSPIIEFNPAEYIQTASGNIISRKCSIYKPQNVEIPQGKVIIKENVILRGDLMNIQINKYTMICQNTIIRPSYGIINDTFRFIPLIIGSNCYIGENSVIEAATIGLGCYIGNNCIIGKRVILKDYVRVEDDTIVPADTVITPFSIVSGKPGKIIGEVNESITSLAATEALARYQNTIPKSN
uniref:Dynactin subunit 5 n=1 Tax=Chromulina nebulosa TaxID=96789 RepID=A0A7S0STE1_9STRA|mmetsp:Transcript_2520/g.2235  ORF Transcript_2520/g.2235 Transcript_2520/m.2235 type:complete len:184 (+) Transcript_2520:23-574(+)